MKSSITFFSICWILFQTSHKHPRLEWISKRTILDILLVKLTANVYYSKGFRVKRQMNGYTLAKPREVRCWLLSLSFSGSHSLHSLQKPTIITCKMLLPEKTTHISGSNDFIKMELRIKKMVLLPGTIQTVITLWWFLELYYHFLDFYYRLSCPLNIFFYLAKCLPPVLGATVSALTTLSHSKVGPKFIHKSICLLFSHACISHKKETLNIFLQSL